MKKLLFMTIALAIVCYCVSNCSKTVVGSKVKIRTECLGCYEEADLDKLIKYADNGNKAEFDEMVNSGKTIHLFENRLGTVVQIKDRKMQILIDSDKNVWVLERHVKLIK